MDRISDELVTPSKKEKKKLTRSQKRKQKAEFGKQDVVAGITLEKFKQLHVTDPSLESIWKNVQEGSSSGPGFFQRDGLLYRIPSGRDKRATDIEQLVLPVQCREPVMRITHSVPMAGHLGRDKTTQRILQRFYWPSVRHDVAEYCRCCEVCHPKGGAPSTSNSTTSGR